MQPASFLPCSVCHTLYESQISVACALRIPGLLLDLRRSAQAVVRPVAWMWLGHRTPMAISWLWVVFCQRPWPFFILSTLLTLSSSSEQLMVRRYHQTLNSPHPMASKSPYDAHHPPQSTRRPLFSTKSHKFTQLHTTPISTLFPIRSPYEIRSEAP